MRSLDFAPVRRRITPWAAAMIGAAALATAFAAEEVVRVDALNDEVEQIHAQLDQRQRAHEREQRRQKSMTPEQKRIARVIAAQQTHREGAALPVVDRIERAWSPDLALTSLSVDKAGTVARIEGGAANLSHIYQFVERLNDGRAERRTGLLQHRAKRVDGRTIHLFSVSVE